MGVAPQVTIRFEIWQCERNLCGFNAHSNRVNATSMRIQTGSVSITNSYHWLTNQIAELRLAMV